MHMTMEQYEQGSSPNQATNQPTNKKGTTGLSLIHISEPTRPY